MTRVTQRVDAGALDALVGRPPRAAIAFASGDGVEVAPIAFRREGEKVWIGIDPGVAVGDGTPLTAVVLIDDGRYWFELRGITWRGRLVSAPVPAPPCTPELRWFELLVEARVSWDYATLHEES